MARLFLAPVFLVAALALTPTAVAQYEEPPPSGALTVNINNVSANEGNAGTTQAVFTVSLSAATQSAVSVDYVMPAEGNASPGVDYQVVSGSVTIPAGTMSAPVFVPIHGDTLDEPDEGYVVHLAQVTAGGAVIGKHHGLGTIVDDDGGAIADTAPPNTMIHGGPGRVTRSRTARFHLMSSEPRSRFQCKLDAGLWRACGAYKTYRNLKRGLHTLRVRAIDAAGNRDPTPAKRTWRIR